LRPDLYKNKVKKWNVISSDIIIIVTVAYMRFIN
jgi:hypothetical protein